MWKVFLDKVDLNLADNNNIKKKNVLTVNKLHSHFIQPSHYKSKKIITNEITLDHSTINPSHIWSYVSLTDN